MKVCKNCGEINENDAAFCVNCGMNSFDFSEEVLCPFCGAANDKSFSHCTNCGNDLHKRNSAVPYAAVDIRNESVADYAPDEHGENAVCPNCGATLPVNTIFCFRCGASVAALHSHRIVKRKVCPHCNRPNPMDAPYCTYCYRSLADAETEEMQLVHESKQVGEATVLQAFLQDTEAKYKICSSCGALNDVDESFCVNCGLKLDMEYIKRYCVNCGAENPADSKFCSECSHSFDGEKAGSGGVWTCHNCRTVNQNEDNFCSECGAKKL